MQQRTPADPTRALLDVRAETDFLVAHDSSAANIPLEFLAARSHELPRSNVLIQIVDSDPDRSLRAMQFLQARGHPVEIVPFERAGPIASGPSVARLWRPNPFLVESMDLIQCQAQPGRAIDVACGSGRDAVWLALRGYEVLGIDLLPDALARATALAARCGVLIRTAAMDVEASAVIHSQPARLVIVFRFLHRPLFPWLRSIVEPGGFIVYETFHERTRQSGRGPKKAAHLLRAGELQTALDGFEILISHEAVERDGQYFSSILARRPE